MFGDGKTALRGGYGIAYDDSAVSMYEQAIFDNPPYVQTNTYPTATLDNPAGAALTTNIATATSGVAPPALRASPLIYQTPYVQQFSLDIQQAITPTMTLDVGYFGDHGTHLQGVVDINELQPGAFTKTNIGFGQQSGCSSFTTQFCEAPLNQIRPYPGLHRDQHGRDDLQLELQLAAGEGDQEIQRQEHDRCQLHLEPGPYQRAERLLHSSAEHLQHRG